MHPLQTTKHEAVHYSLVYTDDMYTTHDDSMSVGGVYLINKLFEGIRYDT